MTRWTQESLEQMLAEYGAPGDLSDAKARRRLKLVRAATELFVEQGYRKTRVEEVARRAGVAKGTVYLYFKTKGELLLAAIVEEKRRYLGQVGPVFDEGRPGRDRLKSWLHLAFVLSQEMPLLSRLLGGDMEILAALDEMPADAVAGGRVMGLDLVGELVDLAARPHRHNEHELRDRAQVLMGLVYCGGLIGSEKIRGELSVERFATILADMLIDGIGPAGGKP